MDFTGERFIPHKALGEIEIEHKQRYYAILELLHNKVVLDAACGEGYGSDLMASVAERVYGLDISSESIEWARNKYNSNNLSFINSSIETIPLPDSSVDVVVSFETIEHVNEEIQMKFMKEVKRVLKEDGMLIISTPDKKKYSDESHFRNPFHVKEFYLAEFELFLSKFYSNVSIFHQGFETFSILSSQNDLANQKFKMVDTEKIANKDGKYIVAICSEKELPESTSINNIMLLKINRDFTSRLFVDFGGGFSEDVVVYSDLFYDGKSFRVEFKDLKSLPEIKGAKWVPLKDQFIKLKISNVYPNIELQAENLWNNEEGWDEFQSKKPEYILHTNSFKEIDKIIITGDLSFQNEEMIHSSLMKKINELEVQKSQELNLVKIEEKVDLVIKTLNEQVLTLTEEKIKETEAKQLLSEENTTLKKNIEHMLRDFDKEVTSTRLLLNQTIHEKNQLFHEKNHILSINNDLNQTLTSLMTSESWRLTKPLRGLKLGVNIMFKKIRKWIKKAIKLLFKMLPLNYRHKEALKAFIYTHFRFLLRRTAMYSIWLQSQSNFTKKNDKHFLVSQSSLNMIDTSDIQPGRIAIHLHLYYIDLLEEFFDYFNNMPYRFDLYVSITDKNASELVANRFETIKNIDKLIVKVTPNQGRDVAPMFVDFAKDLVQYDFISHVHSKKSLYTGTQQDGWRGHLLDNLFGDPLIVKKVFGLFNQNKSLGLVYPETYKTIPYWAHTWLSNKSIGNSLLSRLGIKHDFSKYLDFPAGTMYWARTSAIKPLFDLNLTYNDFAKEDKQIDGTIAHAIERSMVPIVCSNGNSFVEINVFSGEYRFNKGSRNLMQYWPRKINELKDIIDGIDVVSFDIFDTLITRPLLKPDAVFKIIELKAKKFVVDIDFVSIRKAAEDSVRKNKNYQGDCSIDEIYNELTHLAGLDESVCQAIKNIEIDWELRLAMPRNDVVEVLNYAKFKGKRIVLISDMYLTEDIIKKMLNKCNVNYYDELWVSSGLQKRKDNGQMWDHFKERYQGVRTLHIGDNEHSDVQIAEGKGLLVYHVMSGVNMFYNTDFGNHMSFHLENNDSWGDSVLLGPIVSKEFNSPFKLAYTNGQYQITDLKTLGYTIFGPILFSFIIWLLKKLQEDKVEKVLFLAREGYLLKKLFDISVKGLQQNNQFEEMESIYFLTSRRAASVASLENPEDVFKLLEISFEGTIKDLIQVRFGVSSSDASLNKVINLPEEIEAVKREIKPYIEEILMKAKKERTSYKEYTKELGLDGKNVAVVDVGYSGTIQFYLSKFFNQSMNGYYFVTSNKQKGIQYDGNMMKGFFGENEDYATTSSAIYKYQLLLEGILTSNQGQFVNFEQDIDGKVVPNFAVSGFAQHNFESLKSIMEGIEAYFNESLRVYNDVILDVPLSGNAVEKLIETTMVLDNLVSEDMKRLFIVEDTYCMSSEISVFNHYKKWFGL
ncbi:rhamnan synthesis F family protein [Paenibacillus sp. BAC0078]